MWNNDSKGGSHPKWFPEVKGFFTLYRRVTYNEEMVMTMTNETLWSR